MLNSNELRELLVQVAKSAEREGLCKHKSGNFSLRDPETGDVFMSPSGVARDVLEAKHIAVLALDGKVKSPGEGVLPSSESLMHLEVYRRRKDVQAIVHTHSPFATAFAVAGRAIPPIVYEISYVVGGDGYIPVAPYARPGTEALAKLVGEYTMEANACLLANHGAIILSPKGIEDALLRANYVEEVAEVYYRSLVINQGREPQIINGEELKKWEYPKALR